MAPAPAPETRPPGDHGGSRAALLLRISPYVALAGSFAISFIFVASLHLWKLAGYRDAHRDAPATIQRRSVSALLSCICSAAMIIALAQWQSPRDLFSYEGGVALAELLGLTLWDAARPSVQCLVLTAALFAGPFVQHLTAAMGGYAMLVSKPGGSLWVAARNYAIAPFTEEFVFRACLLRLWVSASFPTAAVVFLSPPFFALAHAHHYVEHLRRSGDKQNALMQVGFQVFYTSLFGIYSNFLLMRTGSTIAVILAHSFCNHQGFPELGFCVHKAHPLYRHRLWIGLVYLLGVAAFAWLLWPLTSGFRSSFGSG